eukprot:TRINITY_DN8458_c0_g1_i1.p1 TRINITY_DN8458_c0_g1~~TRINITY_DN8458_c0_g1_i1.p1  ORF type:complete len:203 (+),score=68.21 TRINITY_DN8458_c0_g1_i1:25-633(+)
MDKEDLALPKATVGKLIKEVLPADIKCAPEARDLIADCCLEFVQLLSSESNDICSKEGKKLISPEHIVKALEVLGFVDFLDDIKDVHVTFKKDMEARPKMTNRLENSGKTPEQLMKEQQELFAKARQALSASGGIPPAAGAPPKAAAKKGPSDEDLFRQQQELFAQARARSAGAPAGAAVSPLVQVGAPQPQPAQPQPQPPQ